MVEYDVVIKNCHMLDPDLSILYNATIFIRDGRIDKVDADTNDNGEYQAEERQS